MVVAEWGGHRVSVFSPSGKKTSGTYGSGPGQVLCPCEVAVDGEGNILVADSGNYRIQKLTSEGQFLASVGTKGSGHLKFAALHSMLVITRASRSTCTPRKHCEMTIIM